MVTRTPRTTRRRLRRAADHTIDYLLNYPTSRLSTVIWQYMAKNGLPLSKSVYDNVYRLVDTKLSTMR